MTPAESPIADAQERREALDPARSFCVQAPAGSGKTELLTQRILRLLALCERPEEVLAITFTRKAAAEMRARLLASLWRARALPPQEVATLAPHQRLTHDLAAVALARDATQGWQLLENPTRLRVTTIDSFNAQLTAQLPVASGFGAQPRIGEDMAPLYEEAVHELLARLEQPGDPASEAVARLLVHLDNNLPVVQSLLCALLARRDQWLGQVMDLRDPAEARPRLEGYLSALVADTLAELRGLCAGLEARLLPLLAFAAARRAEAGDETLQALGFGAQLPAADANCLAQWRALAGFLLTNDDQPRKRVDARQGFPPASAARNAEEKARFAQAKQSLSELCAELGDRRDILDLLVLLRCLPEPHYNDAQWELLEALTGLLPLLVAELMLVLRRRGQVDYVQVSSAALEALGSEEQPTDLALRLDYRIRHILVDEFQDTSSLQIELLRKLTRGWQPDDGRTLFIVGDGMQSCYGFRNADVGLFLAARDHGIGAVRLVPLQLKVNFRSQAAVVDWVNQVFGGAFPARDDIGRGAVRYSPSTALHQGFPEAGVETLLLGCDKEAGVPAEAAYQAEAREVLRLVQELRAEQPQASIAILVRYRTHLKRIIPALREAGIAWNASDIDPLPACPPVRDLLSLCRALLNLADRTAWLALLRTPFVGLGIADIERLSVCAAAQDSSLWHALENLAARGELSADGQARLARTLPVLRLARARRGRLPLRDCLEAAWIALGGPATLDAATQRAPIADFFQLLEQQESLGDLRDIHDFERQVARQYVGGEQDPSVRLHIMTIHKAKGLEFDFVILPGLGRLANGDDKPLIRWKEHTGARGEQRLYISLPGAKGRDQDSVYQYLGYEQKLKNAMESTRLLYIGVTRAAKRAWLLGHVKTGGEGLGKPAASSLLATLWPQLEALYGRILLSVLPVQAQPEPFADQRPALRLRRLPGAWRHPGAALLEQAAATVPQAPRERSPAHRNLLERQAGEIIHACLKQAVEGGLDLRDDAALSARETLWALRLRPCCADPAPMLTRIREHLHNVAADPRASWLLDPKHPHSACELSLSDYRDGRRREYVVDRTFVDADGTRWIIDYKSSLPAQGQALASFLREQEALYREQLETYAELFRVMEDRPLRIALFFTALPCWHELSLEALVSS